MHELRGDEDRVAHTRDVRKACSGCRSGFVDRGLPALVSAVCAFLLDCWVVSTKSLDMHRAFISSEVKHRRGAWEG